MKPAANLSLLWPDLPYLDRFDAAGAAGFTGVEVLFPYDVAAKETRFALLRNGLEMVLINAPPPNYTGGARGFAAVPGGEGRFASDMRRALRYVQALGAGRVHVMAGEAEGPEARRTMVANLRGAADTAPEGLTLCLEPLNPVAMPGYFLNDYTLAAEILDEIDRPNVALQYDSYHAQMIHGDAVAVWQDHAPRVRHVQLGDTPDRGSPGSGTVDFPALFAAMAETGYDGWVSGEYHPRTRTEHTLDWMALR